jgi:hypothetical protein
VPLSARPTAVRVADAMITLSGNAMKCSVRDSSGKVLRERCRSRRRRLSRARWNA